MTSEVAENSQCRGFWPNRRQICTCWCARHRVHHRDVDDNDRDPYSIGRGFWFAHVGWLLRDYESGHVDFDMVRDLQKIQEKAQELRRHAKHHPDEDQAAAAGS